MNNTKIIIFNENIEDNELKQEIVNKLYLTTLRKLYPSHNIYIKIWNENDFLHDKIRIELNLNNPYLFRFSEYSITKGNIKNIIREFKLKILND